MQSQHYALVAVDVLQYQTQNCATRDLYAKHGCSSDNSIFHPMNADIDKNACFAVMRVVMRSKDRNVFWRKQKIDEVQLIIKCVQIFGDKS